jgi:hypothetical protein
MEASGWVVTAVAIGAPAAAVIAAGRAVVDRRRVPMAAIAVLTAIVPAVVFLTGVWTAFASSEAAGEWIMRVAGAGVVLTAVVFVLALASPQHRRIAGVMCGLAVATVVPAGVLLAVAHTAGGRHADWADGFPVAGTARTATDEERGYLVDIEYHAATRTFESPGVGCDELSARLAAHAGVDVGQVRPANDLMVPEGSCVAEVETRWRGAQAVITPDGRLVVVAWSPTADLFVF